jgi:hypothetical protein
MNGLFGQTTSSKQFFMTRIMLKGEEKIIPIRIEVLTTDGSKTRFGKVLGVEL